MRGYFDAGYDKLMQGVDPNDDDHLAWLTDEGECSECGYDFDLFEVDSLFVAEESGVTADTPDGPAVHWASGYIACPNCHAHLPYEMSS